MKQKNKHTNEIRGKNVLIVGYGREGASVHRYLALSCPNIRISIADKKIIAPKFPVITTQTGERWLADLHHFDTIVRSPGVSKDTPELVSYCKGGGWLTSATNIFFSRNPAMVIGVTGTKGKSTTSSLIGHLLSQKFSDVRVVGNIGKPALDFCANETHGTIYVFELSSHQLSDVRYSPNIAVVLPVVSEHLDYYGSFDAYFAAKSRMVMFQKEKDSVVYSSESETATAIAVRSKGRKIVYTPSDTSLNFSTALLGNKENIAAAVSTCLLFGLPREYIQNGLRTFIPLPHRLEFIGEHKGIRFYNDSLATIPEATIHAIQALGPATETLIAGGFDRGISYEDLGKSLSRSSIKTLILMGATGRRVSDALQTHNHAITSIEVLTMKDAVEAAYTHTASGKICVLSPAATSFDQFKDYKDRGEQFAFWVKRLAIK